MRRQRAGTPSNWRRLERSRHDPVSLPRLQIGRSGRMEKIRVAGEQGTGTEADGEVGRLKARHDEIEKRLSELERHLSLTPDEQVERSQLKKEKLRAKDRLTLLTAAAARQATSQLTAERQWTLRFSSDRAPPGSASIPSCAS